MTNSTAITLFEEQICPYNGSNFTEYCIVDTNAATVPRTVQSLFPHVGKCVLWFVCLRLNDCISLMRLAVSDTAV